MLARSPRSVVIMLALAVLLWPSGPPPALAADMYTELRTYPGVVLIPPDGLTPFDALRPARVEVGRPSPNAPQRSATPHYRYLIQYRDTEGGSGSAQIGGTMGGAEFDQAMRSLSAFSFRRCAADASYCTENVGGQDGAAPASEVFRGLSVDGGPAVAEHVVCCGGHYWSLTWYDGARDMTYNLVLVGPLADMYGDSITRENQQAAERIAGVATQLVVLE
jgi:hypothetical protein